MLNCTVIEHESYLLTLIVDNGDPTTAHDRDSFRQNALEYPSVYELGLLAFVLPHSQELRQARSEETDTTVFSPLRSQVDEPLVRRGSQDTLESLPSVLQENQSITLASLTKSYRIKVDGVSLNAALICTASVPVPRAEARIPRTCTLLVDRHLDSSNLAIPLGSLNSVS